MQGGTLGAALHALNKLLVAALGADDCSPGSPGTRQHVPREAGQHPCTLLLQSPLLSGMLSPAVERLHHASHHKAHSARTTGTGMHSAYDRIKSLGIHTGLD